ncbi:NPR1-like protein 3 [Wolffia australiana]
MAGNISEPSSALSFASSYVSNGSSADVEPRSSLEIVSLSKLSSNLERLLVDKDFDCSDAEIVVEGEPVAVHRCILAARSKFFYEIFAKGGGNAVEGKHRYQIGDLVPEGAVRVEAFKTFLGYLYTGKLRPSPVEVSNCADGVCAHDACGPAINFAVEMMYASSLFQISELVSLLQRRLINFIDKALVEDVIPILLVAHRCRLSLLQKHCVQRVSRSNLDYMSLAKELPADAVEEIKLLREPPSSPGEASLPKPVNPREKTIQRIHRALDSDDIELLMMLLEESNITLDDANALHYAVSYCDSKIIKEILPLEGVDVNLKNSRGYTPLHLAARRREPAIVVSLLDKGASVRIVADDGQTAATICRRLTRAKDYNSKAGHGQETNKDRLCIEILERELRRDPIAGEELVMSPVVPDDLHMKLLYLENRVAFARLFFPMEAKVAMEIAQADQTLEFGGLSTSRASSNNLNDVDLNETPIKLKERLQTRMEALRKTVELGKRYFPNCSSLVDKFMDDDIQDLLILEKGPPEDQSLKRMRFIELKEDVLRAFTKDKAQRSRSVISSSSSSSSSLRHDKLPYRAARC